MWPRHRDATGGSRGVSNGGWAILLVAFVGATAVVAIHAAPFDVVGPVSPTPEWEWNESADTIRLSHAGGEAVQRETLSIWYGNRSNERVPDLGAADDERLVTPFAEPTVSRGDALELDEERVENGPILLMWESSDGTLRATLAHYEYANHSR